MTIHKHLLNVAGFTACEEAREWAAQYITAQEVFDNCARVDWLFWWCARLGQYQQVIKAAKEIASSVAHLKNNAYAAAAADADAAAAHAAYAARAAAAGAADAAAAHAAYAAAAADAAYAAAAHAAKATAIKRQKEKNLQIARKHLTCPWHEENQDVTL